MPGMLKAQLLFWKIGSDRGQGKAISAHLLLQVGEMMGEEFCVLCLTHEGLS